MALLDITGGTSTSPSSLNQSVLSSTAQTAPQPDAFVSRSISQKLDADYYTATESGDSSETLSGSGNLNFATLQAQQNDLTAMSVSKGDNAGPQDITLGSLAYGLSGARAGQIDSDITPGPSAVTALAGNGDPSAMIKPSSASAVTHTSSGDTVTQAASGSIPADPVSQLQNIDTGGGRSVQNAGPGPAGPAGQNGTNGTNGTNGADGADGNNSSGGHCCGPTIIDIDITGPTIINGPTIVNGPILGDTTINLGDITQIVTHITQTIENIDLSQVTNIVNNVTETVETIVNILPPVIGDITDIVDGILNPPSSGDTDLIVDLGLADLPLLNETVHVGLDVVETIIGDVDVNIGIDGVLTGDDTTVTVGGELLGTALPDIAITIPTTVEELLTDPAGALTDVVTGLPETLAGVTETVSDLLGGLAPPPAGGDTDLVVDLGIADAPLLNDTLHVGLDVVEAVIGDVDVNAGIDGVLTGDETTVTVGGELLGTTLPDIAITIPTTVEELLTDPAGALNDVVTGLPETLAGVSETVSDLLGGLAPPPAGGDTDLVVDLGIGGGIHVPLDIVETITGDLDITAGADLGQVTDAIEGLLGGCSPAEGLGETLGDLVNIEAGGGPVGEIIGGILSPLGGGDVWPEAPNPVENVLDTVLGGGGGLLGPVTGGGEGLGLLDLGSGSGGGLFGGGGKSGGLFGGGLFG